MSQVFAPLWTSYLQGNRAFVVVHGLLLAWAIVVFVRAMALCRRDRAWLADVNVGGSRLGALCDRLGGSGRLELRDLYETRAGVDSDDLARIANLLLLIGVVGTLWGLFGGAREVVSSPAGASVSPAEAMLPVLKTFTAFSVTIVSVSLAFVVLIFQRVLGRAIASVAYNAAQAWNDVGTTPDLRATMAELTEAVRALGQQGIADRASEQVQRITTQLTANAQAASHHMLGAARAFTEAFDQAVAPLATRVSEALGPMVERLDRVSTALSSSTGSLEVQRELLHQQATALAAIDAHLGTAEAAVQHVRDVPSVLGSSLQDIGKQVGATLETLHASFERKLEQIFQHHEGAVLTVAGRMRESESALATAVERVKGEVTQYLVTYGNNLSTTVDGMLANAARTSDASIWTPVRAAVEEIGAVAQRTTQSVSAVEQTAVSVVNTVQRSVAALGERARQMGTQLDQVREAMTGGRGREASVAHWVSTGVLTVAMLVLCTLYYTRLGH